MKRISFVILLVLVLCFCLGGFTYSASVNDLQGITGKIGKEDVEWGAGTFTVPSYSGGLVTLTKVPSLFSDIAGKIKGCWSISNSSSIDNHSNPSITGSLAWVIAQARTEVPTGPICIEIPDGTFAFTSAYTVPDDVWISVQPGAKIYQNAALIMPNAPVAGDFQIFYGTGAVSFTATGARVNSAWWPNADIYLANASLPSVAGVVEVTKASTVSQQVVIDKTQGGIECSGWGPIITPSTAFHDYMFSITSSEAYVLMDQHITNCHLDGRINSTGAAVASGIKVLWTFLARFDSNLIQNTEESGFYFRAADAKVSNSILPYNYVLNPGTNCLLSVTTDNCTEAQPWLELGSFWCWLPKQEGLVIQHGTSASTSSVWATSLNIQMNPALVGYNGDNDSSIPTYYGVKVSGNAVLSSSGGFIEGSPILGSGGAQITLQNMELNYKPQYHYSSYGDTLGAGYLCVSNCEIRYNQNSLGKSFCLGRWTDSISWGSPNQAIGEWSYLVFGDNTTGPYSFPYPMDWFGLIVEKLDTSLNSVKMLDYLTDYTIAGGGTTYGTNATITLTSPLSSDYYLMIHRSQSPLFNQQYNTGFIWTDGYNNKWKNIVSGTRSQTQTWITENSKIVIPISYEDFKKYGHVSDNDTEVVYWFPQSNAIVHSLSFWVSNPSWDNNATSPDNMWISLGTNGTSEGWVSKKTKNRLNDDGMTGPYVKPFCDNGTYSYPIYVPPPSHTSLWPDTRAHVQPRYVSIRTNAHHYNARWTGGGGRLILDVSYPGDFIWSNRN
jgi:hypothetical protein